MPGKNADTLQQLILVMINNQFPNVPPTEEEFLGVAVDLRKSMAMLPVSDQEFDQILRNLKASLFISMDVGTYIYDRDSDHQSWIPGRRAETEFYYWNRYRRYLETVKGWNSRVTTTLDTVSDEILDLLGDPKRTTPWQRRGLVLGDVQSGKTANYTAICNKAADTGYKVIIVLAGITDNLRIQTQERLDKEFSGRLSKNLFQLGSKEIRADFDGVGRIDATKRISAFTTTTTDFNSTLVNGYALTLRNISEPALFVVKKNSKILANLEHWLRSNNADANDKIDLPLLLIDDEADNASVNTKKNGDDPTAVNAAIRSILSRFTRASYLGITATPFANIFIDPEGENDMIGDDLFPRDFIYVLRPPSNYIGADAIYGDSAGHAGCLERIDKNEIEKFFPFKHKKNLKVDSLPPSLDKAMGYFVLANAIRDARGDLTQHRSMLVNVSRFTDVQIEIKERIAEWLGQVRSDIGNYAGRSERDAMKIKSLFFLKEIWDAYRLEETAGISWLELQQKYLHKAAGPIEVRAVNQATGAASLDYYAHKDDGFRVIAVGGNSLSRGLTLEGLCVSYVYRNSRMYDTLLQMGRWFGYRPNYEDIVKVWMAKDAIDWYGYITEVTNELKAELSKMNQNKLTPRDFGLKVRQNPGSLLVTALNKMRTGTLVKRPISVQGRLLETPRLKSQPHILAENERVFRQFVAILDTAGYRVPMRQSGILWEGIPKDSVVGLLRNFNTHPWHLAFQGPALANFIESAPGLSEWAVVIPNGKSTHGFVLDGAHGPISVNPEGRTMDESSGMIRVSGTKVRVGSTGSTRAGLTDSQIGKAEREFLRQNPGTTNFPDRAYLIKDRKPILMLHVLEPIREPGEPLSPKIPDHLFAIGVGLPKTDEEEKTATYVVNLVDLRNWMEVEEDEDDEDAD